MKSKPFYITDANLSNAWARAIIELAQPSIKRLSPLVVTVENLNSGIPEETFPVRDALNFSLQNQALPPVHTVASTIFPSSLWNPSLPRQQLYERYTRILPRLKQSDSHNKYGLYFERLIAFGGGRSNARQTVNQLEHIISTFQRGNHRHTAMQAAIFDPLIDHTDQRRRGFPCLQQVSFAHDSHEQTLAVTGFYATQYIFDKAYGNYLGLCRLGQFVAHQLGLKLTQMICVADVAEIGSLNKQDLKSLLNSNAFLLRQTT